MLRSHRQQPIRRCWIDHPYGEEEITLLEEELLPVLAQLLERIEAIDAEIEAAHQAEVACFEAAQAAEAPAMPT